MSNFIEITVIELKTVSKAIINADSILSVVEREDEERGSYLILTFNKPDTNPVN